MAKKVFISFYNKDIEAKQKLLQLNNQHQIFVDGSVDTGDITDDLTDETIRLKIRDEYLRDSSVTIVLFGNETSRRKHVDWEIGSSMIDSIKSKKSGIIVIILDSLISENNSLIPTEKIRKMVSPEMLESQWGKDWRVKENYDFLGERLSKNIVSIFLPDKNKENETAIPIIHFSDILKNHQILSSAIDYVYENRRSITYDTSIPFRKNNS